MNHRPRKRFGQHFLHDPAIIDRIVSAIAPRPGDRIVEIGPGQGALTLPLLDRVEHLDVVELDRDLAAAIRGAAPEPGRLSVHAADALRFDFASLAPPDGRLRVVGNLPYNISTPLIFHLLGQGAVIEDMHFMLQREVVDRIVAAPGERNYGRLGIMVQLYCETERLFRVGPGAFNPPPRVDSAVVRLRRREGTAVPVRDERVLADLVTQAFSQRRKTLRNCLRGTLTAEDMVAAGIDPGARPETLSLGQFAALANRATR